MTVLETLAPFSGTQGHTNDERQFGNINTHSSRLTYYANKELCHLDTLFGKHGGYGSIGSGRLEAGRSDATASATQYHSDQLILGLLY